MRIVCLEAKNRARLTVGKVYSILDGMWENNWPHIYVVNDDNQFVAYTRKWFALPDTRLEDAVEQYEEAMAAQEVMR